MATRQVEHGARPPPAAAGPLRCGLGYAHGVPENPAVNHIPPPGGRVGGKNIRYAARLLFADPRLIPVLMLESDVPEFALLKEPNRLLCAVC